MPSGCTTAPGDAPSDAPGDVPRRPNYLHSVPWEAHEKTRQLETEAHSKMHTMLSSDNAEVSRKIPVEQLNDKLSSSTGRFVVNRREEVGLHLRRLD